MTPASPCRPAIRHLAKRSGFYPRCCRVWSGIPPGQRSAVRRAPTFSSSSGLNRPFSGMIWQRTAHAGTPVVFLPQTATTICPTCSCAYATTVWATPRWRKSATKRPPPVSRTMRRSPTTVPISPAGISNAKPRRHRRTDGHRRSRASRQGTNCVITPKYAVYPV